MTRPPSAAAALVALGGDASQRLVAVPLGAIDTNGGNGFRVRLIDPDTGEVQLLRVILGLPGDTTAAVLSGLEPGEKIVAAGVAELSPGQAVTQAGSGASRP